MDWFANAQNITSGFILYEYGQVFLVSILVMALDKVLDGIFGKKGSIFGLEMIGDILCKLPYVLVASLIADKIYSFCGEQIAVLPLEAAERMMFTVAVISLVGGIVAIVLAGGIVKSFLQCGLKLLVVSWTYVCCIMAGYSLAPLIAILILWILLVFMSEVVGQLIDTFIP